MTRIALKKLMSFIVALALVVTFGACASTSDNSTGASTAAQGAATVGSSSADTVQKPVTIVWWHPYGADALDGQKKSIELTVKRFQDKYPNIQVKAIPIVPGTDYRQQYDKALMSGEEPTVWRLFPSCDVPTRAKNGTVADVTDLMNNFQLLKDGNLTTTFDNLLKIDNKWYGLLSTYQFDGMVYNSVPIKASGADPANMPKTWSDFATMGQKITDKSVGRFGYTLLGMDWNAWPFTAWLYSAGGEMVHDNGDGTWGIGFNEDPGVTTAMFWNDMVWKYQITQKDVLEDFAAVTNDIASGHAAFGWTRQTDIAPVAEQKFGGKKEDFGLIPIPAMDANHSQVVLCSGDGNPWTFSPKASKEQLQAAFTFASFVNFDKDFNNELWKQENDDNVLDGLIPNGQEYADIKFNAATSWPANWKTEFAECAKYAKPEPACPHWNDLKNDIAKPLQKIILKQGITKDEVKKILDDCANNLYSKYPDTFKKK
jgi:multiple sugar transport system substrate-binding protein